MTADDGFLDSLVVTQMPRDWSPGAFDCGEPDLTEYLCDGSACNDEMTGFARTYCVHSNGAFVGYFSVLADSIRLDIKERPPGARYASAPALKVGRIGVDLSFRGREVGNWILDYVVGLARVISARVGVRYVTVDALVRKGLIAWYSEYGFVANGAERDQRIAFLKFKKRWKQGDSLRTVSMRFDVMLPEESADSSIVDALIST